jgi:hypothetical protein
LHQLGREMPLLILGARLSKPVYTTWCPCLPGQTRMRYDGTPNEIGMNPYLTAKLGARKREAGSAHRCRKQEIKPELLILRI